MPPTDVDGPNARESESTLRHSVKRRIERIELLLAWDGEVRRSDLTDFFGVSEQQASSDISKYKDIAPQNLYYDTSAKRYFASPDFDPAFLDLSADRYLMQLRLLHAGVLAEDQTWFRNPPAFDLLPTLESGIAPKLLRKLIFAMRHQNDIEIEYQSMSQSKPGMRRIAPHSLAHSGRRWHVRAWCYKREAFRDFVINRILMASEPEPSAINPRDDEEWETRVPVYITPHRKLSESQKNAITLDFGLKGGRKLLQIRHALLFYFVDFYRLDPEKFGHLEPRHLQIEMENWQEIRPLIS